MILPHRGRGTAPRSGVVEGVIRIPASEVLTDVDGVADKIVRCALSLHQPAAGPPPHAVHGEDLVGAI
jgi:hypothetical protein